MRREKGSLGDRQGPGDRQGKGDRQGPGDRQGKGDRQEKEDRQGQGDWQGKAAHAFPERDSPGSGFAGVGGRVESCGRGNWVRTSGRDGFSAAGLSPLVFFLELAGVELPVLGITALKTE